MKREDSSHWLGLGYAVTIFVSAFLLFQVQPLIGKYILPWFGGTPAVWTTCMLFFQGLLFGGYAYAHLTTERCSAKTQGLLHLGLILAALCVLPISPHPDWKPAGTEQPTLQIMALLAVSVGLPFFILSSTGPLVQRWFNRTHFGSSPYRLYALSNLGSLLALVSYPFAFEPTFATDTQAAIWSWGFVSFAGMCAVCAVGMIRESSRRPQRVADEPVGEAVPATRTSFSTRALWFGLAMAASVMLLATTNQVCMDVAAVPFLWVLPLTLYLLSFILCFDSDRWYSRRLFTAAQAVSTAAVCALMLKGAGVSIIVQVLVYFTALFFCAMVCHGELVRLKPAPRELTSFYLVVAAGGAAGGLFVGIVAPIVFPAYLELHVGMLGCCLLTLTIFFRDRSWTLYGGHPRWAWGALIAGLLGLVTALGVQADEVVGNAVTVSRNFYGVLRVKEEDRESPAQHRFKLMHGRILHGMQFVSETKRLEPTAYYGRDSGVGLAMSSCPSDGLRRVGLVGLGVGTLAAYAKPGDDFCFYEINPEVVRMAHRYFTYLKECPGEVQVVLGDARLSLERESPRQFDVLVLDAFSGDAIPAHLLTVEAFEIYRRHLKPDGVLAVHISNLHFNLQPVVSALADHFGMTSASIQSEENAERGTNTCLWFLASSSPDRLDVKLIQQRKRPPDERRILWTDERSNLFEILR